MIVLLLMVALLVLWLGFPPINDVTTTPEAPPRFRQEPPGDVPYPLEFTEMQQRAYPDLAPLSLPDSVPAAFAKARGAARRMRGWTVVSQSDSLSTLQAVARTRVFGFVDDVVVEIRPAEGGSSVHVRSRSRVGRADFGTNARRIRSYLDAVK